MLVEKLYDGIRMSDNPWHFYIEGEHFIKVLISTPTVRGSTPEKVLVTSKGGNLPCKGGDWMTGEEFGQMLRNQAGSQWRCSPSALWWAEKNQVIKPGTIKGERERAIEAIQEENALLERVLSIMNRYGI